MATDDPEGGAKSREGGGGGEALRTIKMAIINYNFVQRYCNTVQSAT